MSSFTLAVRRVLFVMLALFGLAACGGGGGAGDSGGTNNNANNATAQGIAVGSSVSVVDAK